MYCGLNTDMDAMFLYSESLAYDYYYYDFVTAQPL